MKKLLSVMPHASTGGLPQVLVKRVEIIKDDLDIYVVEFNNYSNDFIIQKNRIKKLLKPDHYFTLGDDKTELLNIIDRIQPDLIHFEEIPELFNIDFNITKQIYKPDRKYKIFETTHSSDFQIDDKIFFPDKFLFVSQYNCFKFNKLGIPSEVIEYPVEKKERDPNKQIDAMKKLGLDPNYKHVVNVGLFTPRKNQAYAFEIAKKLLDYQIKFHFIGNQADNFQDYWRPLLKNKPDNCILWNERDDVDTFLDACDLFLFTSRGFRWNKELNPLVIKEALEHQIPQFLFPLDVYNRKYDTEDTIHYLDGDVEIDSALIKNFLYERRILPWRGEFKKEVKYKIRAVHLLLEEDDRRKESIKELERLKNFGIDYIQHINKRYDDVPPREMCARPWDVGRIGSYSLKGPHYGNYQSFKRAIYKEFTNDIDFLLILESDCKLVVPMEEFVDKIFKSCDYILERGIYYMSYGDNRNLRTGEMVSDNCGDITDWMYITNKIIGIQSIMFPKFALDFIKRSYETTLWDVSDLMYNEMFKFKTKAIAPRLTNQIEGVSMIQGENIQHFLLKNEKNLLEDKNPNDIVVEYNKEEQRFHFCLSDFYQESIKDIKIIVSVDNKKNIFQTIHELSPHSSVWVEIYGSDKYEEFYFDFYYKDIFLFRKNLVINTVPNSEKIKEQIQYLLDENKKIKNINYVDLSDASNEEQEENNFSLDFNVDENKIYIPYKGSKNEIIYGIRIRSIGDKVELFKTDEMKFSNKEFINWVSPARNLYKEDPNFNGFEADFIKDNRVIFTKNIVLRNSTVHKKDQQVDEKFKYDNDSINALKNLTNEFKKDTIFVVLTYPNTKIKEEITEECLKNLKSFGDNKIILSSHYPVSKNLQDMVDYYIYDSYNPLISHSLYNFYWSSITQGKIEIFLDKLQKNSNLNQSLTVLNNMNNSIKFANSIGYDKVICMSYDFILNKENIDKIKEICNKIDFENKNGYFMRYYEGDMELLKTVFFIVKSKFYSNIFNNTRTPEEYNKSCNELGSHNFLENYFSKKLNLYSKDLIIEDTDEEKLFNNPNINIFSGVEYLAILPVKEQDYHFIVWFNSSNNKDDRRLEFIYNNNGIIENCTHFIKERSYYYKKFFLQENDNYVITANFIDSSTDQIIDTQYFNINRNNFDDILQNGLFTEN